MHISVYKTDDYSFKYSRQVFYMVSIGVMDKW